MYANQLVHSYLQATYPDAAASFLLECGPNLSSGELAVVTSLAVAADEPESKFRLPRPVKRHREDPTGCTILDMGIDEVERAVLAAPPAAKVSRADYCVTTNSTAVAPHGATKAFPKSVILEAADELLATLASLGVPESHIGEIERERDPGKRACLGLVAGSLVYQKKPHLPITVSLSELAARSKRTASNLVLLTQAAEQNNYNFAAFILSGRSLADCTIDSGDIFERRYDFVDLGGLVALRQIRCVLAIDEEVNKFHLVPSSPDAKIQLTIVSGESGSGKTASALASAITNSNTTIGLYHAPSLELEKSVVGKSAEDRNVLVADYLLHIISALDVDVFCDRRAVLVLDELGSSPTVVRALCSIYVSLLPRLQAAAKTNSFFVIAVGTGADGVTLLPGSAVSTYRVVRMDQLTGETFLRGRLKAWTPQLRELIRKDSEHRVGREAWRLLTNRRVAAALQLQPGVVENMRDPTTIAVDWRHSLTYALNSALLVAKTLNGFARKCPSECMVDFRDALAYAAGGPQQQLHADHLELIVSTGIIVDNGTRLSRNSSRENFSCVSADTVTDPDDKIFLHAKYNGHRFGISVAAVETGLRGFGVTQRPRSGDGFEDTIRDFLFVQMLIGSSAVSVSRTAPNSPTNVLQALTEQVRKASKDIKCIVSVTLAEGARTVDDAVTAALESVAEEMRRSMGESWNQRAAKIGLVIKNKPLAKAADVFAVAMTVVWSHHARALTVSSADLKLALQMKHYATTTLTRYDAGAELYKMGDRRPHAISGQIAANVDAAALKDAQQFNRWMVDNSLADWLTPLLCAAAIKPTGQAKANRKNVDRDVLYGDVLRHVAAQPTTASRASTQFMVIALVSKPGSDARTKSRMANQDCVVASEDELAASLYPVMFMPRAMKSVDPEATMSVSLWM